MARSVAPSEEGEMRPSRPARRVESLRGGPKYSAHYAESPVIGPEQARSLPRPRPRFGLLKLCLFFFSFLFTPFISLIFFLLPFSYYWTFSCPEAREGPAPCLARRPAGVPRGQAEEVARKLLLLLSSPGPTPTSCCPGPGTTVSKVTRSRSWGAKPAGVVVYNRSAPC